MRLRLLLVLLPVILALIPSVVFAESKGTCPPWPSQAVEIPKLAIPPVRPPRTDLEYAGKVSIEATVSDTGYICATRVLSGIDQETNDAAEKILRAGHFGLLTPRGARPVPIVVVVQMLYWRDKEGHLLQFQHITSNARFRSH
jgi:hypothetical protein